MEINGSVIISFVFCLITIGFSIPYLIASNQNNKDMKVVFKQLTLLFGILGISMFIYACFEIGSFSEAKAMLNEIPYLIIDKIIKVFTN